MAQMLKVSKNNALIASSYRLTLTEMQIVLYGIGLINPLNEDFPLTYQIKVKEFARMFGREHKQMYGEIKTAVLKQFWERDFSYVNEDNATVTARWLTSIKHKDATGFIEITFSPQVQPYLHQLKDNFTSYYIEQIAAFKSFYSVRFYEFSIMRLNQCKANRCTYVKTIDSLKHDLMLEDKYKRFCNLRIHVLEIAQREINTYSDINIHYEIMKVGRTPTALKFLVDRKKSITGVETTRTTLAPTTLELAKKLAAKAGTGWDVYAIEQQFYDFVKRKGAPENLEGAFIGFVKKKIAKPPQ